MSKNAAFCAALKSSNGVAVDPAERQPVEADLGADAIQYKLTPAGLRQLFQSLSDQPPSDQSLSGGNPADTGSRG
ncbi:hypothetical protein PhaeoP18_00030 [Phaeobacter piscinae]|uniref:Uncharacterized protein n=1 Tax=Phaeobacter piscinae TaxID=1580596 RepID=A0AAN1L8Z8_9RHOB|nr:hypothetical protein [Phaeobacter piscinae]ATG42001.1 hypothetical protein PhaeoP13_00030 [Phaeobacter piscinae]AUQ75866.1 hypothetical protein PhaeoP71_03029 [Phaeobacter piscinae]AUR34334.1 hypothetical protein PhaeoP18_00030 [Phaeobacter piscinae]